LATVIFYPYFPDLLSDYGDIRYKTCVHNAVENLWTSRISAYKMSYFSCGFKWNYVDACEVKWCGVLKAKWLDKVCVLR